MPSWTLTDVERDIDLEQLTLQGRELGNSAHKCKITKRQLHGGLRDGVDIVEIDNGPLRVAVLPTRGMGVWKAWQGDLEIGWQSPVKGPVHPAFVPLWEPSGIGWLNGFDELLVRCGLESNGAPEFDDQGRLKYPLHGKIANLPAHKVELSVDDATGEITLVGQVDEGRMFCNHLRLRSTIKMRPGEMEFQIIDEVENPSDHTAELELLYHINLGPPLLAAGSKFVAPVKTLVPRNARAAEGLANWDSYGPPQQGFVEQVYLMELFADGDGGTEVLLKSSHGERGLSLKFNTSELPKFTLWKSTQTSKDGYVTGLEPCLNFPNPRSYEKEQGRVAMLAPGERRRFAIEFAVHDDPAAVAQCEAAINKLRGTTRPDIKLQPLEGWTIGS